MAIKSGGELDRRIELQRLLPSGVNTFNEPVSSWASIGEVWARRRDASDSTKLEYLAAGQVGSYQVARFTVRSTSLTRTLTPLDRIQSGGHVWQVTNVKELSEGRGRFLELTASRDADNG